MQPKKDIYKILCETQYCFTYLFINPRNKIILNRLAINLLNLIKKICLTSSLETGSAKNLLVSFSSSWFNVLCKRVTNGLSWSSILSHWSWSWYKKPFQSWIMMQTIEIGKKKLKLKLSEYIRYCASSQKIRNAKQKLISPVLILVFLFCVSIRQAV